MHLDSTPNHHPGLLTRISEPAQVQEEEQD